MTDNNENKKKDVSYVVILILIITAFFLGWWNYASLCTPVEAFSNFVPKGNFKLILFPLVKIYYIVLCILFFLFPMYLFLQAMILLKNKMI